AREARPEQADREGGRARPADAGGRQVDEVRVVDRGQAPEALRVGTRQAAAELGRQVGRALQVAGNRGESAANARTGAIHRHVDRAAGDRIGDRAIDGGADVVEAE